MINSAGHCSVCHQDIGAHVHHACGGISTPCGPSCFQRRIPSPAIFPYPYPILDNETDALRARIKELEEALEQTKDALKQIHRNDLNWFHATAGAMSNHDAVEVMRKVDMRVKSVWGILYPPDPAEEGVTADEPLDNNF